MKKKFCISIAVIFTLLLSLFPITKIEAYDPGYYIEKYNINVDVKEDGVLEIEEDIDVFFTISSRGIFRYIPTSYEMNWNINGTSVPKSYKFPISNIQVENHESDIDYRSDDVYIRIGEESTWLKGSESYKIKYRIHTKDLDVPELGDLFYLNLIGDKWDTTIDKVNVNINFPKAVDFNNWEVTSGYTGNTTNEHMTCSVKEDGLRMQCTSNKRLEANQSITVSQPLGNDYFNFPSYTTTYLIATIVSLGILLLVAIWFFKHGRDEPIIQTVEFSAPEGLNSACVGYIIDDVAHTRDIISLILEWAKDGYIHIVEEEKDLKLIKIKDFDDKDKKPKYESRMFNKIFNDNDERKVSTLKYKFADELNNAMNGVKQYFKPKNRSLYTKSSKKYKLLTMFLAGIPLAAMIGISVYTRTYRITATLLAFLIAYAVVTLITGLILYGIKSARNKSPNYVRMFIIMIFILNFGTIILKTVVASIAGSLTLHLLIGLSISIGIIILGVFMDKRTEYGSLMYGKVAGLKEFIKTAEEDRLKMLAKDNPYIFYDILPYAYAFDLTDVWGEHFKNLDVPEPEFFTSSYNYPFALHMFIRRMNSSMNTISTTMTSVPPSQKSSGGGTFSGGGGGFGGSSGGGFGGGGGGRW